MYCSIIYCKNFYIFRMQIFFRHLFYKYPFPDCYLHFLHSDFWQGVRTFIKFNLSNFLLWLVLFAFFILSQNNFCVRCATDVKAQFCPHRCSTIYLYLPFCSHMSNFPAWLSSALLVWFSISPKLREGEHSILHFLSYPWFWYSTCLSICK